MITSQKFSNFRVTETISPPTYLFKDCNNYEDEVVAEVDVETTYLWLFKNKKTLEVYKKPWSEHWRHSTTGDFVRGIVIEGLARKYYRALRT